MKNKKFLIETVADLNFAKMTMSEKDFNERCIISPRIISSILAESCLERVYFEDSRTPSSDELNELKRKGFL